MIDDSNREELIDLYLAGKLEGEDLREFEAKLHQDKVLQQEVGNEKRLIGSIKAEGRAQWHSKLNAYHQEMQPEPAEETNYKVVHRILPLERRIQRKILVVAAVIFGLLIGSAIIYNSIENQSRSESLFIAYFKPFTGTEEGTRGEGPVTQKEIALKAYSTGNYPESIRLFKNILRQGDDETMLFYLGNAYLSENMPLDAEKTFKNYLAKYTEFAAEARWYLALSQLKLKKMSAARKSFEEIVILHNDFSARSAVILKQLGTE